MSENSESPMVGPAPEPLPTVAKAVVHRDISSQAGTASMTHLAPSSSDDGVVSQSHKTGIPEPSSDE
jgi:hypothetical protein